MGHFGLRGIIPANKFDALMERLYQEHPYMQSAVDAAIDAEGMSRAEAVEEYLADYAASLDTSIVAKVWNAIKGFLNRIGFRFGDEAVRYLVSQARAYNRTGNPGIAFDVSDVIKRLYVVEYGKITSGTGRFATAGDYYADNRMAGLMIDTIGGVPKTFNESWEYFKAQGVDSLASYDKFKATFLSLLNYRARLNPGLNEMEKIIDQGRDISMSIKVKNNEKLRKVLGRSINVPLTQVDTKLFGTTTEQTKRINEALYAGQRWAVSRIDRLSELGSAPLYTFDDNGNLLANQLEINRLAKQGQITFEMMRDGFDYTVMIPEGDKMVEKTERFAGYKDITEQSIEWTGYLSLRESVNDVELQLLRARYLGAFAERGNAYRELGEIGNMMLRAKAKVPELVFVAPFIKTPINILKDALSYTPASLFMKSFKGRRDEAAARVLIGTGLGLMAGKAVIDQNLTGSYPKDPGRREAMIAAKIPEYSVKIGDTWYSYARIEPLATVLITADLRESSCITHLTEQALPSLTSPP